MSLAYILFMTTDGGVRIIVLLHAFQQGFTALALASIFGGYELAGVIVNILAGMAGAVCPGLVFLELGVDASSLLEILSVDFQPVVRLQVHHSCKFATSPPLSAPSQANKASGFA